MLTFAAVLQATGARPVLLAPDGTAQPDGFGVADLEREIQFVTIDSRSVAPGSLFIALPGERVDGHAFVGAALAAGARACMVSAAVDMQAVAHALHAVAEAHDSVADRRYLFVVPHTLAALQNLAAHWRSRHTAEVIGVTGSVGKTTTKEIIASVLSTLGPVLKNTGNFNTEIGLPLTVLLLKHEHRAAVLEMGMYAPGDIALLAGIARPRIGVVTNVAPVHLERLGSIERIARTKSELVAALPLDGLAVLNGDDRWTRAMAVTSGIARTCLVGVGADCDYRAADVIAHELVGISFTLHAENEQIPFETRVPGTHVVHAFLAAIAIAREMGLTWPQIQDAVRAACLDVRQHLIQNGAGMQIIDDSYNASPLSMSAALELLRVSSGEKIAVLGDMLELGPEEEEAHLRVGAQAARIADWLVTCGPRGAWIASGAERAGLPARRVLRAETNAAASEAVLSITNASSVTVGTPGEPTMPSSRALHDDMPVQWTVLVKGSRGMEMEEIVTTLGGDASQTGSARA